MIGFITQSYTHNNPPPKKKNENFFYCHQFKTNFTVFSNLRNTRKTDFNRLREIFGYTLIEPISFLSCSSCCLRGRGDEDTNNLRQWESLRSVWAPRCLQRKHRKNWDDPSVCWMGWRQTGDHAVQVGQDHEKERVRCLTERTGQNRQVHHHR